MKKSYNIKKVCQITGVNANTLRTWERRYHLFEPTRTETGRRLYTDDEITKIRYIAQLVFEGHAVSNLQNLSLSELKKMTVNFPDAQVPSQTKSFDHHETEIHITEILAKLNNHISQFELRNITQLIELCRHRMTIVDFITRIVMPLLHDIGQKVEQGFFSIAQEHAISAIIKFELVKLLSDLRLKEFDQAKSVILCTPEGEFHEFGALCAAILFANHGWKIIYLGSNMPTAALIEAAQSLNPDVIAISNIYPEKNSTDLLENIQSLLTKCPQSKIWIGGNLNMNLSQFKSEQNLKIINNFETLINHISHT